MVSQYKIGELIVAKVTMFNPALFVRFSVLPGVIKRASPGVKFGIAFSFNIWP